MRTDENLHILSGAYALDALDELERASFEDHLASCSSCRLEVASFQETAARLGAAESTPPPVEMRGRVLSAVGGVRQLRPEVVVPRQRRLLPQRLMVAAAAAALLGVGGIGGIALDSPSSPAVTALEQVQGDPDRRVLDQDFQGGRAELVVSGSDAVLTARGAAAPEPGQVYQVWVVTEAGPRSAGVLHAGADGTYWATLGNLSAAQAVAVTLEPSTSSTEPTSEPVFTSQV